MSDGGGGGARRGVVERRAAALPPLSKPAAADRGGGEGPGRPSAPLPGGQAAPRPPRLPPNLAWPGPCAGRAGCGGRVRVRGQGGGRGDSRPPPLKKRERQTREAARAGGRRVCAARTTSPLRPPRPAPGRAVGPAASALERRTGQGQPWAWPERRAGWGARPPPPPPLSRVPGRLAGTLSPRPVGPRGGEIRGAQCGPRQGRPAPGPPG